jgi:hypothetical protein
MTAHQLHLQTNNSNIILIELLNNDFVDEYVMHLKKIKSLYSFVQYLEKPRSKKKLWNQTHINQIELEIKNSINGLNVMGLNFPIAVDSIRFNPNNSTQQLLNQLHRHFTTGHRSVSYGESTQTWLDNTDLTFEIDTILHYEEFSKLVHNINDMVHQAELYYLNQVELNFLTPFQEYHVIFNSSVPLDPTIDPQSIYFQLICSEHYQYFSDNTEYDVWLPSSQIQGKNWWRAYFDSDSPVPWDIGLNINYSGSFSIGARTQAKDPNFLHWLKQYDITPGPLHVGMPLGKIVDGHKFAKNLGISDSIVEITVLT